MGDSGLFKGTVGARAAEADAPIGFDETPPDTEMLPTSVSGASAFSCYDHTPRTIVPPLTNGGTLRAMDNRELADWLSTLAENIVNQEPTSRWGRREFFNWLSEPMNGNGTRR